MSQTVKIATYIMLSKAEFITHVETSFPETADHWECDLVIGSKTGDDSIKMK